MARDRRGEGQLEGKEEEEKEKNEGKEGNENAPKERVLERQH